MRKKITRSSLVQWGSVAVLAVGLSACGGGGGSPPAPVVDPDTVLHGFVMDGPLVGARVCLDTNSNWVCDANEPSAISSENGAFTLSIAPLKYQETYDKQIIAEVGPDALDEATGMTLNASGQAGYVLTSWGGPRPILSPINTLLAVQTLSSGVGFGLDTVNVSDLLDVSGLSKTSEHYFDATSKLTLEERDLAQRTGRMLAQLLSSAHSKLKTDAAAVYGSDTSQLGARTAELVIQALRNTRPASSDESEAQALQRMQDALSIVSLSAATEALEKRGLTQLTPEDGLTVLGAGLADANALGSTPRALLQYKLATDTGLFNTRRYRYINSSWSVDTTYSGTGAHGYHLISKAADSDYQKISVTSPTWLKEGSVLNERFSDGVNAQANEVKVVSKNLSGLTFDALPDLSFFSGTFAQGHQAYWLRRKALNRQYLFDNVATFFTSLSKFRSSPQTCYEGICWSITQAATGNAPEFAGRMTFKTTSSGGSIALGEGRFVEDVVAGVTVLRMISVPIEVQNRSTMWSAKDGRYLSFADLDGKLWTGKYMDAGTVWYSNAWLSLDALNAVLASNQISAFGQ